MKSAMLSHLLEYPDTTYEEEKRIPFKRVVFVMIDSLREDFLEGDFVKTDFNYTGAKMTVFKELIEEYPDNT